jgi:IS30 family transposase
MAPVGRPRVLDEAKRREICALVSAGCGIEAAARYVGCAPTTIRREALRNDDFHDDLRQAELTAQLSPLRAMRQAAATHWRAAAWLLERTHPERFAKQNPKNFRPEQVEAFMTHMAEVVAEEISDEPTRQRVYRRLLAATRNAMREAHAVEQVRRGTRRSSELPSPGPLPEGEGPEAGP